ncbi:MAG: CD1845 family protein [Faecalibacterium sp.]|nr:CD1845 family protein [Faecalibacterium sp.]MDY5504387.1 CD1845 family protein [Faecalibacterium sp.]
MAAEPHALLPAFFVIRLRILERFEFRNYNRIRKEEKEALTMKILLKILCAPMIAVLSVFVWLASKLVQVSAVVMNFIAIAVGLGALCILFDGKTAQGICGLIAAFLFTPFGLPMISIILLGQVQKFRYWIQDSVYG